MIRLQLSKKDLGEYKATLKDERGQDVTVLEIGGKGKGKAPATPRETRVTAGQRAAWTPLPPPRGPCASALPRKGPDLRSGAFEAARVGEDSPG